MTEAIAGLSSNDQILWKESVEMKQLFSLYLEYSKQTEKFSKFVKCKVKEFEKQQLYKITKAA